MRRGLGIAQSLEVVAMELWATNASVQLARARKWRPKGSAFACAALRQLAACKTLAQLSLYAPPGRSGRRRIGAEKRRRGCVREAKKRHYPTRIHRALIVEGCYSYTGAGPDGDG